MLQCDRQNNARVIELLSPVYGEVKDRFEVLALLGGAHFRQENYAQSVEILEKAIALKRPEPPMLNMLANAQYREGNLERALQLLKRSLSLDANQDGAETLLGKLEAERAARPGR